MTSPVHPFLASVVGEFDDCRGCLCDTTNRQMHIQSSEEIWVCEFVVVSAGGNSNRPSIPVKFAPFIFVRSGGPSCSVATQNYSVPRSGWIWSGAARRSLLGLRMMSA